MGLVSIGEFARRSRLSPKALRLYDELGLLPPASIDPDSGYRWYEIGQLERARLVASMRHIGMPLAQIKVVLGLEAGAAAERPRSPSDLSRHPSPDCRQHAGLRFRRPVGLTHLPHAAGFRPAKRLIKQAGNHRRRSPQLEPGPSPSNCSIHSFADITADCRGKILSISTR